jgi:hypothetical protein
MMAKLLSSGMKVALVGGAFAILAVVIPLAWQARTMRSERQQRLILTDILAYDGANHLVLDVKVSNPRTSTVFPKRFGILIDSSWSESAACCVEKSSHDYAIDLSVYHDTPISNAVSGGGVDRFRATLVERGDPGGGAGYAARPYVVYNDADSVIGPRFTFFLLGITDGQRRSILRLKRADEPAFENGWRDIRKTPRPDVEKVLFGPKSKVREFPN